MLDLLSLVKTKHAVLNKRSSSYKPKSVTFKEEEEMLTPNIVNFASKKSSICSVKGPANEIIRKP